MKNPMVYVLRGVDWDCPCVCTTRKRCAEEVVQFLQEEGFIFETKEITKMIKEREKANYIYLLDLPDNISAYVNGINVVKVPLQ